MANNDKTKILLYDLDKELQDLLNDLKQFGEGSDSLYNRLTKLTVNDLSGDTKEVIEDLINAYNNDFKGSMTERVRQLEAIIDTLKSNPEEGNMQETFEYATSLGSKDVVKHTSTGDKKFQVSYGYGLITVGPVGDTKQEKAITSSSKTYQKDEETNVEIKKTYTYNSDGDIIGIQTETFFTPVNA